MTCERDVAERFAEELRGAWDDQRPEELLWEAAARRAGIGIELVRVAHRAPVFLLGQQWIVEVEEGRWQVREWWGAADPYYNSATELAALD